jgi:hypothetical protein
MADDKRNAPGGRRKPTTIDLKATEIASEPVKPTEPADIPQEPPRAETPPEASAAPEPAKPAPEPPQAPQSAARQPEWLAAMNARLDRLRDGVADRMDWRLVTAGVLGAAVTMVVFLVILATGVLKPSDDVTPLARRVAQLDQQTRELANRPQPQAIDPRALAELAARVSAAEQAMGRLAAFESRLARAEQGAGRLSELEQRVARAESKAETPAAAPLPAVAADPALANRIATLEAALRPLADVSARLETMNTATRDAKGRADAAFEAAQKNTAALAVPAATSSDVEALNVRVAALEQGAKVAQERIASTAGADKAGRLAFVAVAMRSVVERGDPFAAELAAVKPLVADPKTLAALEPFAVTGLPRSAALARELSQLTAPMLNAAGAPPREGGFIDRLQANAERLVRIRPINEAPGDDAATVITRADVKAAHGDLAGAAAEIASLPAAVRAPAQAWIGKVEARNAALAAARSLAEGAVGALAKP